MKNKKEDLLGDRMKRYEQAYSILLPARLPVMLRLDGKAFHTYTRGCQRPFDVNFIDAMNKVALVLCAEVQGTVLAFVQSSAML